MKRQLRITKAGDETLRSLLVSCSQYILGHFGPDTDLRRWGLQLAERGGPNGRKRAVVAVARKLSVLLLRLWVTGEVHEPLRNARFRGVAPLSWTPYSLSRRGSQLGLPGHVLLRREITRSALCFWTGVGSLSIV